MQANINLAPASQYAAAARRRQRSLYVLAVVIVAAIVVTWAVLFLVRRSSEAALAAASGELAGVETEIARLAPDAERIELFEGRLSALDTLLDSHISWGPVLGGLERLLPPTVVLTSINVNYDQRTMELRGISPNIDEVAQALASLTASEERPTLFRSVTLNQVQREEERDEQGVVVGVSYTFSAKLTLANEVAPLGAPVP